MMMISPLKRCLASIMMVALVAVSVQAPVLAGMIDNSQLSMQSELQLKRDDVRSLLARDEVRSVLLDYGVSSDDVDQRINNLTAEELNQVHGQLASLPAGEGAGTVLTVLLILILLEIVGAIDIFPRI